MVSLVDESGAGHGPKITYQRRPKRTNNVAVRLPYLKNVNLNIIPNLLESKMKS